jgi:hypothetical protein
VTSIPEDDPGLRAPSETAQEIVVKLGGSILQLQLNLSKIVCQLSLVWHNGHEIKEST